MSKKDLQYFGIRIVDLAQSCALRGVGPTGRRPDGLKRRTPCPLFHVGCKGKKILDNDQRILDYLR